jgi:phage terminase small subunit
MGKAIVPRKETGKPGAAMATLTPRQREFVRAMLETGARDHTLCARMAGFTGDDNTMRVTAHRLAHDDKVLAALKEEADKRIRSGAVLGASVLSEIAMNPTHKDQLKAAIELLNRAGLITATLHKHEHAHVVSTSADEKAQIASIVEKAARLGIDPRKLLGGIVVDAEFEEVQKPDTPAAGTEGLEDIL